MSPTWSAPVQERHYQYKNAHADHKQWPPKNMVGPLASEESKKVFRISQLNTKCQVTGWLGYPVSILLSTADLMTHGSPTSSNHPTRIAFGRHAFM